MKVNIYKTASVFFIVQSLLIVLQLNNNYMGEFSFLQTLRSDLVDLFFGLLIFFLNLAALVVARYLYLSGEEAERLKITALKQAFMAEQNRIYKQHHHDLKNHLTVVLGLMKLQKYDKLQDYLQAYLHTVNDSLLKVQTGVDEIDVLISAKIQLAKNKDIQVELKITANIESNMKHSLDLVTILGNAFDNAIEAVQVLDSPLRKISVFISQDKLDYIIESVNPFAASGKITSELFLKEGFSTKQEGRGQGLFIIKRLTERLDGTISINTGDGQFRLKIELPKYRLKEE